MDTILTVPLSASRCDYRTVTLFSRTTQLTFENGIHEKEGPLLIEGATGTGKTQAAALLASRLGKKLFEVNLAALSEGLLEARMRGYRKGSFTGAHEDRQGFFELADGEVLFLDELQSASLASQTQLLDLLSAVSNRVRVSRLGEEGKRNEFSLKVVLATNRPADELLKEGKLREDLFHRIRDVVRFKDLGTLLREDDYTKRIFTLLRLYHWRSFEYRDISDLSMDLLFPLVKKEIAQLIRAEKWPGNFRQFERFAYDVYWRLERHTPREINEDLVQELLDHEKRRFQPCNTLSETKTNLPKRNEKVRFIEEILKSNGMNIAKSLPELEHYKLKARSSLKSFLLKNQELFSSQFLMDSKIRAFMGISGAKADDPNGSELDRV